MNNKSNNYAREKMFMSNGKAELQIDNNLSQIQNKAIETLAENLKEHLVKSKEFSAITESQINNLDLMVKDYEIYIIRCALINSRGNQRQAAKLLKINATTLNSKIKRYGILSSGLIDVAE